MRLACYGWVEEQAGSVAAGNYFVLRELLARGHEVDLYANEAHLPPPPGLAGENFRYIGCRPPLGSERVPVRARPLANWLFRPLLHPAWKRVYESRARPEHERRPYDALLSLGTPPAFLLAGAPTVTWLQGPLHTEVEAIRRLRDQIISVSGRDFYLALLAYYKLDQWFERHALAGSDHIIVGSEWARRAVVGGGIYGSAVHALPYPIDLDRFSPDERAELDWGRPRILMAGRLDPRKRLDLALDAFELVHRARPGARLQVVGRRGYAPRQLSLVAKSPVAGFVDYSDSLSRDHMPDLFRRAALLVQTSENENFGSSPAEALACGTPVVLGPSNGTRDYIDATSAVFERYDPEAVAEAILHTLDVRSGATEHVRASTRAVAERFFAPTAVVDRLLDILEFARGPQVSQVR